MLTAIPGLAITGLAPPGLADFSAINVILDATGHVTGSRWGATISEASWSAVVTTTTPIMAGVVTTTPGEAIPWLSSVNQ